METNHSNGDSLVQATDANNLGITSLAKLDHIVWKVNTYRSVLEGESIFEIVDCHHCRLAKWYYERDGQASFAHTPSYRMLEAPHATVHRSTERFLLALHSASISTNDTAIAESLEEMEKGSEQVLQVLDQIILQNKGH
ncbi:CZB domain-containing protein [Roseiconus lacunae]|uniref:CZB domain-containing protein n=1 Tax=Roseiconus lacunae TaxID=2605694 RepID=UPI003093CF64|nr:CZB domain-containing protein [Stieleria sp. HD01]